MARVQRVRMSGRVGHNAFINGDYEPTGELYNARPLYRQVGDPDVWLLYTLSRWWAVTTTESKVANNNAGRACSVEEGLALPQDAKSWEVHDGEAWVVDAKVQLSVVPAQVSCLAAARLLRGWRGSCCLHSITGQHLYVLDW